MSGDDHNQEEAKLQPSRRDIYGDGWARAALGSMGGDPVVSTNELDLDAIERIASEAASHHSGRRWVVDEESDNTDVRANLGAGPTVCTTIPLGYDIRRANAAHIASMDPATTLAMVAEVRRLRDWQRKVSDACGLTEIHMGYSPWVPDATPALLAMIEDTFTRSLYHAECERIEWERAVARGEVEPG